MPSPARSPFTATIRLWSDRAGRNASVVANTFPSVLALNAGEFAYTVEAFFTAPELDALGYYTGNGVYSRCMF